MLKISPDINFDTLAKHEWLLTNGIGGFAASSITGANTRRYHGLLTAAFHPPTDRTVMVSKVEECFLSVSDCVVSLSSNRYPDTIHPTGFQHMRFFERKPFPCTKFEVNGFHLLKTVFMVYGSNTTVVEYENTGESDFNLRLTPLFVYRDYHALFRREDQFDFYIQHKGGYVEMYAHYGAQPVFFKYSKGEWQDNPTWFYNFVLDRETERGLDDREDAYAPAQIDVILQPGEKTYLIFSTDEALMKANPELLKMAELKRLDDLLIHAPKDSFICDLLLAADQFVVQRLNTDSYSLIAGYHWFTDWGRDTMIALRGLCIAADRQDLARSILNTFLKHIDQGMLPNCFPDQGNAPEYNTMDATLWLFVALYEYDQKFQDRDFIESVFVHLTEILKAHFAGTRYNIGVTPEGFLSGGQGLMQLTWMDARVGDHVVTPRHGCPVEIQALWYNTLRIYQYFADILERPSTYYAEQADHMKANFKKHFLRPDGGLYDVVIPSVSADNSIRPNQIYVVSLPFSLLDKKTEKKVVEVVASQLHTPFGLRTLASDAPAFNPTYEGSPWQRDTAYHQGTVWPFLLGEYAAAFLKVNDWSEVAQKEVLKMLDPLKDHFYKDGCLHAVSEIFDGQNPSMGKGAVHQAWSVSALLKILFDIEAIAKKPKSQPSLIKSKIKFLQ